MHVFLNGRLVPARQATISVFDRSFLYGDGVFETLRVHRGVPFLWDAHLTRLQAGAKFLRIPLPLAPNVIRARAEELIRKNRQSEGVLRLELSRGVGVRGYSPKAAAHPLLVMTTHPAPTVSANAIPRWRLITSRFRLPARDPLAPFKTNNRLPCVLARAEAEDAGVEEALLLNTDGNVAEAASGNLFWVEKNSLCTPPLNDGPLAGITRLMILQVAKPLGLKARQVSISPAAVRRKRGVFLAQSVWGIIEIAEIDGRAIRREPVVDEIFRAYWAVVDKLCAGQ